MITARHMREALRYKLGSHIVDDTPLAEKAAVMIGHWIPGKESLESLEKRAEDLIFNELYNAVGSGMSVTTDDGVTRRVRLDELKEIADDAMYPLFDSMKVYSVNYGILRDHAIGMSSFRAMQVLVLRYGEFMDPQEKHIFKRIIRENWPEERWREWLTED